MQRCWCCWQVASLDCKLRQLVALPLQMSHRYFILCIHSDACLCNSAGRRALADRHLKCRNSTHSVATMLLSTLLYSLAMATMAAASHSELCTQLAVGRDVVGVPITCKEVEARRAGTCDRYLSAPSQSCTAACCIVSVGARFDGTRELNTCEDMCLAGASSRILCWSAKRPMCRCAPDPARCSAATLPPFPVFARC